jgi:hypothetical protein
MRYTQTMIYPVVLLVLLAAALPARATLSAEDPAPAANTDFTRYQLILDRKPFGDSAAAAAVAAAAAAANPNQPPLSSILKLVALEADDETGILQAGIVDLAGKKNHYLNVGDEEDGIKLIKAEYKADRALVRKGDQEEWLTLGAGPKTPVPAGNPNPPEVAQRQKFLDMMKARSHTSPAATPPPAPTPPVPSRNITELKEHYRKLNMDLIRAGGKKGPPLPIRLSPEDDATLVKEGVLPPPTKATVE